MASSNSCWSTPRADVGRLYGDYFLPKGTFFLTNVWAIHRDEAEFELPDDFFPERWRGSKFATMKPVLDDNVLRVHYGWGSGRRVCAGQRLAENSFVSLTFPTFRVSKSY